MWGAFYIWLNKIFSFSLYSAGVGRSGTFIALDRLLDQSEAEGEINIFQCVNDMRKDRVNMIQTVVSTKRHSYIYTYNDFVNEIK